MADFNLNRFGKQVAEAVAKHVNEQATAVYRTHHGRDADTVLRELERRVRTKDFMPDPADLRPLAEAISRGEKPPQWRAT